MLRSLPLLFVMALPALAGSPGEAVAAALADAKKQPDSLRPHVRYLSLYAVPPAERKVFLAVLAFHCNSLSREPELIAPALVAPDLVRVSLLDYGWDGKVWEKLAAVEPYFHAKVAVEGKVAEEFREEPTGRRISFDGGRTFVAETQRVRVEVKQQAKVVAAHAPWLPAQEIAALAIMLNSDAPIVRADWFLVWTAIQIGRGGAGYYDWLGLKSREDLEKLVALDRAAAKRLRLEIAAIVAESGVSLNNRQVVRFQALTGGYWATLDTINNAERRNAVRVLNGDFQHDAEEIYGVLPNRLFVVAASDAKGALQDTVPDNIAPDHAATGNDRRIHPGMSCFRCHSEGLKPIDDWARKVYRGPVQLSSPDPLKLKRLRQLYLSDLPGQLEDDVRIYTRALKALNGLTPAENAKGYGRVWQRYAETSLGLEETALELGTDAKTWRTALETYGRAGNADPVLLGLLAQPEARIRREHWDEVYAVAQTALKGVKP